MNWQATKEFIDSHILNLIPNPAVGRSWLDQLDKTREGERLGVCIAIDVKSKSVSPQTYANLFALLQEPIADSRVSFTLAARQYLAKDPSSPISNFTVQVDSGATYARVIKISDFIKYHAPPHYTQSDLEEVREVYFRRNRSDIITGTKLTGGHERVWVLPLHDLIELINGADEEHAGTLVNDVLGLGKKIGTGKENLPEFVFLRYPSPFSALTCTQPTAIDRDWIPRESYYISYRHRDFWGRTHCCSGEGNRARERVHGPVSSAGPGFSGGYIGLARSVSFNRKLVLAEAYRRLSVILEEDNQEILDFENEGDTA